MENNKAPGNNKMGVAYFTFHLMTSLFGITPAAQKITKPRWLGHTMMHTNQQQLQRHCKKKNNNILWHK